MLNFRAILKKTQNKLIRAFQSKKTPTVHFLPHLKKMPKRSLRNVKTITKKRQNDHGKNNVRIAKQNGTSDRA